MKSIFIISLFLIASSSILLSQSPVPLAKVDYAEFVLPGNKTEKQTSTLKNSKNEVEMVMTLFFNAYKSFFSSQDLNTCTFTPSCSVYGLQAMRKRGLFMGGIQTFDRLSRCHGFSRELYEIDQSSSLQIDYP